MPAFKGLCVSIHAEGAPLPEHGIQKHSRMSRISSFVPVPPARVPKDSTTNKPEASRFAISITLLTPGLPVPYSTPKPSADDPYPSPQTVGGLPQNSSERGNFGGVVGPYIPLTKSDNETIAAYIYFDGRAKEEVATLLRPGEETWVNSRWVQVPESEGGGLAEREFLFREVGLERWLNGLDLDGQDAAAKLERRRQKFDKRRRSRKPNAGSDDDSIAPGQEVDMKYSDEEHKMSDEELSNWTSDDDSPPEAAGQIKVAMFRVLASGEIKRGEYSPQFDAHDDDDTTGASSNTKGGAEEADVDHTTSFAKPKTLDPKSISTQTVTGIDGPEKPYATFTFFYRGERQLQKMGLLDTSKQAKPTTGSAKRRSTQMDFSNLPPLKSGGTVGFSAFRDHDESRQSKNRKKSNGDVDVMAEDSDEDDDDTQIVGKLEDVDDKDGNTMLSPEDAKYQGELAEGVGRIKLKRQHSAEPVNAASRPSPGSIGTPVLGTTPPELESSSTTPALNISNVFGLGLGTSPVDNSVIGSPLKKHRASLHETDEEAMRKLVNSSGFPAPIGDILGMAGESNASTNSITKSQEPEEEL